MTTAPYITDKPPILKRKLDELDSLTPPTNEEENEQVKNVPIKKQHRSWLPPSVTTIKEPTKFITSTYLSDIPSCITLNKSESIVLGVDEAGRGPVLGPMVYGVAYALESFLSGLQRSYGFADSKILTESKREELFKQIETPESELNQNIGWATTTITARDISSGMLQSSTKGAYNLNSQAHDTTIDLIKNVLAKGIKISKIFVDTVGPPSSYQAKLKGIFPDIDITVAKKADSIYPIVSAASVVAKVTRDKNIEYYNDSLDLLQGHNLGSGYPGDPNTKKYMTSNIDNVFGWCYGFTRFSWATARDSLVKNGAVKVIYEDDVREKGGYKDVFSMMGNKHRGEHRVSKNHFNKSSVDLL